MSWHVCTNVVFVADDENKTLDYYALCVFLKGMCLRTLGFPLQAEECYKEVMHCEKRLALNTYLPPVSRGCSRMHSPANFKTSLPTTSLSTRRWNWA